MTTPPRLTNVQRVQLLEQKVQDLEQQTRVLKQKVIGLRIFRGIAIGLAGVLGIASIPLIPLIGTISNIRTRVADADLIARNALATASEAERSITSALDSATEAIGSLLENAGGALQRQAQVAATAVNQTKSAAVAEIEHRAPEIAERAFSQYIQVGSHSLNIGDLQIAWGRQSNLQPIPANNRIFSASFPEPFAGSPAIAIGIQSSRGETRDDFVIENVREMDNGFQGHASTIDRSISHARISMSYIAIGKRSGPPEAVPAAPKR